MSARTRFCAMASSRSLPTADGEQHSARDVAGALSDAAGCAPVAVADPACPVVAAVRNALAPLIPQAAAAASKQRLRVVVALSGGLDSMALLEAAVLLANERLAQTQFALSAWHVNHGLSPNADRWAAFCED